MTIVTYFEAEGSVKKPGVYVHDVTKGGPADQAGLKPGDRLVKLDGKELTQEEFVEVIRAKKVGDTAVMTVERGEETLEISVIVGDMNQIHK